MAQRVLGLKETGRWNLDLLEDGSYKYAMGEIDGDLRQYTKEMNAALNGRGGGKPFFVQGSVQATEDEIRNFFEK